MLFSGVGSGRDNSSGSLRQPSHANLALDGLEKNVAVSILYYHRERNISHYINAKSPVHNNVGAVLKGLSVSCSVLKLDSLSGLGEQPIDRLGDCDGETRILPPCFVSLNRLHENESCIPRMVGRSITRAWGFRKISVFHIGSHPV